MPTSPTVHPAFWKAVSAVLLLCLIIQQFPHRSSRASRNPSFEPQSTKNTIQHDNDLWSYDWQRDHKDQTLSAEQCVSAFPELYFEIDRAVQQWKGKVITPESIDLFKANDGGVRLLVHDQQLRIVQTRGLGRNDFRHRIIAVLQQLARALAAAEDNNEPMPDMEFTIVVDDKPVLDDDPGPLWSFARAAANPRHDNIWLIPDFHFFGAPPEAQGFRLQQQLARQHDAPLANKVPKVVWRGVEWTNPDLRGSLLNVTDEKSWADVKSMNWHDKTNRLSLDVFCDFRYVVNTEGRSWSARLTHLLNCNSLVFVHDFEWIAHYYHLLDNNLNVVRVERNFTDLEDKVRYYNDHLSEAQVIADTAKATFRERYTSLAATSCYWRRMLLSWASISFKPEIWEMAGTTNDNSPSRMLRGISFEEFIVHDNTKDYPYKPKDHGHKHEDP